MNPTSEIIFENLPGNQGNLGVITLNRPKALNAINTAMTIALYQQLKCWEHDSAIKAVIIKGNGEKAFCAGGDIKEIYEHQQKTGKPLIEFFWHEYRLNYYLANYPKPYIALMDGITMGGGAGISVHGCYRIATERTVFAMPETSIGFFPDVGGSYFLSRCPGQTGVYLALTSTRIQAADTQYLGLTDYYIHSTKLTALIQALLEHLEPTLIANIFKDFCENTASPALAIDRQFIDECFSFNSVEEIICALKKHSDNGCQETANLLLSKSPTSLKITLEQLRRGTKLDLADCLRMEYRLVNQVLQAHDFYEGVRATLIDKDNQPKWQPKELANISVNSIDEYFAAPANFQELAFG